MLRWISIGLWVLATGCGGVCEFDGQIYRAGETFSENGCNTCTCHWDGAVACTDIDCLDDTDTDDTDTDTAGA